MWWQWFLFQRRDLASVSEALRNSSGMNSVSILALLITLAGCSNKAVYDNVQLNSRNACSRAPPSQYEECMQRTGKSYEEYERERKEVLD